ncbi:hypothetical protein KY330_00195 [Candidatus Woesearchaeota archaeon]|nr:hypothetical protein [Candidatus Woesearchaeota archaeon]
MIILYLEDEGDEPPPVEEDEDESPLDMLKSMDEQTEKEETIPCLEQTSEELEYQHSFTSIEYSIENAAFETDLRLGHYLFEDIFDPLSLLAAEVEQSREQGYYCIEDYLTERSLQPQ